MKTDTSIQKLLQNKPSSKSKTSITFTSKPKTLTTSTKPVTRRQKSDLASSVILSTTIDDKYLQDRIFPTPSFVTHSIIETSLIKPTTTTGIETTTIQTFIKTSPIPNRLIGEDYNIAQLASIDTGRKVYQFIKSNLIYTKALKIISLMYFKAFSVMLGL